jgi:hypothetical protein
MIKNYEQVYLNKDIKGDINVLKPPYLIPIKSPYIDIHVSHLSIVKICKPVKLRLPVGRANINEFNLEAKQMKLSFHAQKRIPQRGMNGSDIDLILTHGTETRDGYFLRNQDAKNAERELRKQIDRINRLAGKYVVVNGETVVTAYHPGRKKQKRILQN